MRKPHPDAVGQTSSPCSSFWRCCFWSPGWLSTPGQRRSYLEVLGLEIPIESADKQVSKAPVFEPWKPVIPLARLSRNGLEREHGVGSPCRPVGVANPSRAEERNIYRWTDDAGQTHFSDKPPSDTTADAVGKLHSGGTEDYSVSYRFLGMRPTAPIQSSLETELDMVFRFLEQQLKIGELPPLHANLVVIKGRGRFVEYRNKYAPKLTTDSGYYNFDTNEAVVHWVSETRSLPVVRHELAHLAIGNAYGALPVWLSEGFSEVIERIEASGNALTARLNVLAVDTLARRARSGDLPTVKWLMQSSRSDWKYYGDESFFYGLSWALLHYLLSEADGRNAIREFFGFLAQNRCQEIDSAEFFGRYMKDGLGELDRDFKRWLSNKQARPLYY